MPKLNFLYTAPVLAFGLLFGYNKIFITKLFQTFDLWTASGILAVLWLLIFFAMLLLCGRRTAKPLLIGIVLLNSVCLYFMDTYHISIDKVMLLNVLKTDTAEAADILKGGFWTYLILGGIVPAVLISKLKFSFPFAPQKLLWLVCSLVLATLIIVPNGKTAASVLRNHKKLKYDLLPVNYIGAMISVGKRLSAQNHEFVTIGNDATLKETAKNGKKNLLVLVMGETARDANFSLSGYKRDTNAPLKPYLNEMYYFAKTQSCGTATAVSLPCMFSKDARTDFETSSESYTENLLDILQKTGYRVIWRDNNSGCQGNCDRIKTETFCDIYACDDSVLLKNFAQTINEKYENTAIVLHQQGSHGPAYYKRFPKDKAVFKPYCEKDDLKECSTEEIVNAYDNSIYYSSLMLADTIKALKPFEKNYNVALLYVSDHGESLGEKGLYLHSAPYRFAPDEQTLVPMFWWIPDKSAAAKRLDRPCLRKQTLKQWSHDSVFHTVLGLSDVQTSEYKKALDLMSACRQN